MKPSKLFLPGPLLSQVLAAEGSRNIFYLHDRLRRACISILEIDRENKQTLKLGGEECSANFRSTGQAPHHSRPDGIVDYSTTVRFPTVSGDKSMLGVISERINLTVESDPGFGNPNVKIETKLNIILPGQLPEVAINQVQGKSLGDLVEGSGLLNLFADETLKGAINDNSSDTIRLFLDTTHWHNKLYGAHLAYERARFGAVQARKRAKQKLLAAA